MKSEFEFGKTPFGEIIKTLRRAASIGLFVEVTTLETSGTYSYKTPAQVYLKQIKAILTYKKEGKRIFSLNEFCTTRIKILSLLESLDLEAERLNLQEIGNQWYFQTTFGIPKVQD